MRYNNIAITITLGCLSIVALTVLVMLPITGNCELSKTDWEDYNNGTAANYYNKKEIPFHVIQPLH